MVAWNGQGNQRNRFVPGFKMLQCLCDCSYFEDEPADQSCYSHQNMLLNIEIHSRSHIALFIFMHHIHVPSGRHVLLIECLHDVMYMKCVFVCVVYVYSPSYYRLEVIGSLPCSKVEVLSHFHHVHTVNNMHMNSLSSLRANSPVWHSLS